MPESAYAETAVTLLTLGLLAVGTFALVVRAILSRRQTLAAAGRQLVKDVRKGEGFTFHRVKQHADHGPNAVQQSTALSLRHWLDSVNRQPDRIPHLFIEGGSGAGKTTLATAI